MTKEQKVFVEALAKGRDGTTWYEGNPKNIESFKTGDFCFYSERLEIYRRSTDKWNLICTLASADKIEALIKAFNSNTCADLNYYTNAGFSVTDGKNTIQGNPTDGFSINGIRCLTEYTGVRYINVKEYGAVGDGVTDDTAAFRKWYAYITANGLTGYIPNGTYMIHGGWYKAEESASHFKVIGESKHNTVIKLIDNDVENVSCFTFHNPDGCEFSNFTIDMNQTNSATGGYAFYGVGCSNVVIEDIVVKNVGFAALMLYTDTPATETLDNIFIDNVEIYGKGINTDNNVYPTGFLLADVTNCHITNCYAEGFSYYTYEFKNFSSNCFVENCTAKNCRHGFYLGGNADVFPEGRTHYTENIVFSNCKAIDCADPFYFGKCKNVTVENGYVENPSLIFDSAGKPNDYVDCIAVRYSENICITGTYWFSSNVLALMDVKNLNFNGNVYRYTDSGHVFIAYETNAATGDAAVYENVVICVQGTNDAKYRTAEIVDGIRFIYNGIFVAESSLKRKHVSADAERPFVTDVFGNSKGQRIEVAHNWGTGRIMYSYYDADNKLVNTKIIDLTATE